MVGQRKIEEPRFVVDVNVGRLAKWLRVLGYDTLFPSDAEEDELLRIALREGRISVTRDSGLAERHVATTGRLKVVLIQRDDLKSQLRQVIRSLDLDGSRQFSRCIRCNEPLDSLAREAVRELVPPYVFKTQQEYAGCPRCHRIFWRGTHWANMLEDLAEVGQREI